MLTTYDPNVGRCTHRVLIHYAQFDHHLQVEIDVPGSDRGLEAMEWALELHWEQLAAAAGEGAPFLELVNAAGEVLVVADDALMQADWLKDMVVGLHIVAVTPEEPGALEARQAVLERMPLTAAVLEHQAGDSGDIEDGRLGNLPHDA